MDGGAAGHIITLDLAKTLIEEGYLNSIEETKENVQIRWGGGSNEEVIGMACGNGLVNQLFVVKYMSTPLLISEILLTQLGIIFIKNQHVLLGLYNGRVIIRAIAEGEEKLWYIDPRIIFLQPAILQSTAEQHSPTMNYLQQLLSDAEVPVSLTNPPNVIMANSARPTYTQSQIRQGYALLQRKGNMNANTLALIIQHDAMSHIPEDLHHPGLWRALQRRRQSDISWLKATTIKRVLGGSGVTVCAEPGRVMHIDYIRYTLEGQVKSLLVLVCEATGAPFAYLLKGKTLASHCIKLFMEGTCKPVGRQMTAIRSDLASEIGAEYLAIINAELGDRAVEVIAPLSVALWHQKKGIDVLFAATQMHETTVERSIQTLQNGAINTMMNQRNLTAKYYEFAVMDMAETMLGWMTPEGITRFEAFFRR